MTDKKHKTTKSGDTARKIWLAGIGAYGRAFSEAQSGFSKVAQGSTKIFEELVQKGEQLEHTVSEKSKETFEKVSDNLDIDERIAKMRARLKRSPKPAEMNDDRLERIEAKLDEILTLLKPAKAAPKKRAAKKTAARKTATRKTSAKAKTASTSKGTKT